VSFIFDSGFLYLQLISDKCADKGVYDFLSLVRTTTQNDANGSCLQNVDDLYELNGYNNDDYCPSPEFDGFGEKPTFEDAVEENDWAKGKGDSWEMSEVPVADSDGGGWGGWGNGGAQIKGKEKVENGSDPWGSQSANAGTDDAWGNSGAAKQKHTSDGPDSWGKKDSIAENDPWASSSKEEVINDPWSGNVVAKVPVGPSGASELEKHDPWAEAGEKNDKDDMLGWALGGASDRTNNNKWQKKIGISGSCSPAVSDNPWGKSQKESASDGLSEQTQSARGLPSVSEWENNDPWDQPDDSVQDAPATPKESNWGNNAISSQKPSEPMKPRENNNARHSSTWGNISETRNETHGKGTGESILGAWKPNNQADGGSCGDETPKHNTWDQNPTDEWPASKSSDMGDPWCSNSATPVEGNAEGNWGKEAVSTPNDGWSLHLASSSNTPEIGESNDGWSGPKSKKWNNDSNENSGRGRGRGRGNRGGRPPRRSDGEGRGRGFSRPLQDPLTSEEENILLEIEPMVQIIRRILRQAMYDISLSLYVWVGIVFFFPLGGGGGHVFLIFGVRTPLDSWAADTV
jgi:hypothetical protein